MYVVVSYDIPDDKRRRKIYKILKDYGYRMQYSVFECTLDKELLAEMEGKIIDVINNREDNVRFYFLDKGQDRIKNIGIEKKEFASTIII